MNRDQLMDHEYDGIREYDNPTPGWWNMIFAATVVFAFFYVIVWHASSASYTIHDTWNKAQLAEYARIFGSVGQLKPDEQTILAQIDEPRFMAIAKSTFVGTCAACHARDGGGDVGVNLCDDSYKNIKKVEDIYRVITEGANGGAMPSWKNRFSDNERVLLAAYVASLRGTTPAKPKAPDGTVIDPWPKHEPKPAPAPATPAAPK